MIENFPQNPNDNQTLSIGGVTFTFNQEKSAWFPPNIPETPDLQNYDIDIVQNNIQVWFPKNFREEQRLWSEIRRIRDQKIKDVEWRYNRYARQVRLNVTPTDDISDLDTYIQALADITEQEDPTDITWPTLS